MTPVADNAPAPSPSSLMFDHSFAAVSTAAHLNPNHAPVVSITHPFSQTSEWSSVGGWISYSDADGDAAVQYQFRDDGLAPNSAYLSTPANAHNPAGTIITVAPTDLTSVLVHSGDPDTSDTIWVRAFDGSDWSAWAPIYFATTASNVSYGAVLTFWSPISSHLRTSPAYPCAAYRPSCRRCCAARSRHLLVSTELRHHHDLTLRSFGGSHSISGDIARRLCGGLGPYGQQRPWRRGHHLRCP